MYRGMSERYKDIFKKCIKKCNIQVIDIYIKYKKCYTEVY